MLTLSEKAAGGQGIADTLTLPYERRQKSRQRIRLDSGREAALMLPPGTVLVEGDVLRASDGGAVRVVAALEPLSVARSADPLRLARACYHLGNRHVAIQVGDGWVRYQPDHVLDDMVRGLALEVAAETACFEPERGAYGPAPRPHPHHRHAGDGAAHGHRH